MIFFHRVSLPKLAKVDSGITETKIGEIVLPGSLNICLALNIKSLGRLDPSNASRYFLIVEEVILDLFTVRKVVFNFLGLVKEPIAEETYSSDPQSHRDF